MSQPRIRPCSKIDEQNHQWEENSAGFKHHNWYGFGAVDADAALTMLDSYTADSLGSQSVTSFSDNKSGTVGTLSDSNTGTVQLTNSISGTAEFVRVEIGFTASVPNSLGIILTSPSGTPSSILQPRTNINTDPNGYVYLASSAFYGEEINGTWTLRVTDHDNDGNAITFSTWALQFYYR